MHSDTDVLIVGAGPTGLTLALLLAGRGRTVAVYERWPSTYPLPRAAGMSHETVRTFQSIGLLDVLAPHLDLERKERVMSLYTPDGEVLTTMTFPDEGKSGYPAMVGFHQPDVDRFLGELCETHPLVEIHRGWNVRALEQSGQDAVVTLDPVHGEEVRNGDPVTARAAFVVGCDGANSTIRSLMHTGVTDTGFSAQWLVVDTIYRPGVTPLNLFGHVIGAERPVTLVAASPGRQRFELMLLDGEDPERMTAQDSVWRLIAPWNVTPEQSELSRAAVYTFRGRWADTWRDGRVLLAGDAAHQTPPFLGQGFNSGVRDTIALAWRIDLILRGQAAPELLDTYTTERLPHMQQIIGSSVAVGKVTCNTDPQTLEARIAAFRIMGGGDPATSEMRSEWRLGPGCLMPDDPAAGFVSRQGRVEKDGTTGLLDDLTGPGRFVLLGAGIDPLAALSDEARSVWRDLGGLGVTIGADGYRDVDGSYAEWFNELGATVVLVRPDYQVYGASADAGRADAMVLNLSRQLGAGGRGRTATAA